jgi:A/G-specific adenine glycosylase
MNSFYHKILEWYDQNSRDLPWRVTKDPYNVWLSEIILQQTRVEQGRNYYIKFTNKYPTVVDLANATEDEVLKLWEGLGYYSRGRNLLFTAKSIVSDYNGMFPETAFELSKLKGIGPYTSAAISSIANNEKIAAVDGNVFRVLSRYFDIDLDISQPKTRKYFEELSTKLIEGDRPGDYNQALMDFGSSICTPKKTSCEKCPFSDSCQALEKKKVALLPFKTKKLKIRDRFLNFILVKSDSGIIIQKRNDGIWKGLYQLPLIESDSVVNYSSELDIKTFDIKFENIKRLETLKKPHKLSHQNLYIQFWEAEAKSAEGFVAIEEIKKYSFPKPIKDFLEINI